METLIDFSQKMFVKRSSAKKIVISAVVAMIGVLLIVGAFAAISDHTSSGFLVSVTIGGVLATVFLIRMFFGSKEMVYAATNSVVKDYSIYVESERFSDLIKSIEERDTRKLRSIMSTQSSSLRLDVMMSQDDQFAACQIYKYVPHSYEAASEVYALDSVPKDFCTCIKELVAYQSK